MAIGYLTRPLLVAIGSGWAQTFSFSIGKGNFPTPDDLTGLSAELTLTQANVASPAVIVLTTDDATLFIDGANLTINVARGATADWIAGDYDFALRIFDPAGDVDRWLVLSIPASSRTEIVSGAPS